MRARRTTSRSVTRPLSALAGVAAGYAVGAIWLRLSPLECLVCVALGGFVAWTCAGPAREDARANAALAQEPVVVALETLPLLPTLCWPATFPVAGSSPRPRTTPPARTPEAWRCVARRPRHARLGRRVARTRLTQHCRTF